ncbi:hypothetical protein [Mucilaginibacter antarcticus]|uniref:Uncharacterized protein n=1 Tax=Mucilaginibacter antarcticus TaxID=1855725 RepID=A0ABW5XRG2_9SPHI
MNDSGYFEWFRKDSQDFMDKRIAKSYETYTGLESKLKALPSIRKILIGGSPYDETTRFNKQNSYPGKSAFFSTIIAHQQTLPK